MKKCFDVKKCCYAKLLMRKWSDKRQCMGAGSNKLYSQRRQLQYNRQWDHHLRNSLCSQRCRLQYNRQWDHHLRYRLCSQRRQLQYNSHWDHHLRYLFNHLYRIHCNKQRHQHNHHRCSHPYSKQH